MELLAGFCSCFLKINPVLAGGVYGALTEHLIRDERDYRHHVDYVHLNPFKHGWVTRVADWPYSSFHRAVAVGVYPVDWCGDERQGFVGGAG